MTSRRKLGGPPPAPQPKTYLVTGAYPVGGAKKGETVELALSPSREKSLLDGGHLRLQPEPTKPAPKPGPRSTRKGAK